jgi:hypothetical protein
MDYKHAQDQMVMNLRQTLALSGMQQAQRPSTAAHPRRMSACMRVHRQIALADVAGFAECLQILEHRKTSFAPSDDVINVEDHSRMSYGRAPTCHTREAISTVNKKPESP